MLDRSLVQAEFARQFGGAPQLIVQAPGRVNLIGEHTDYNDGFVFPVAIDLATVVALRPRADRLMQVHAHDYGERDVFLLDDITQDPTRLWCNYVRGMCRALLVAGHDLGGADMLIAGDVPRGAGLSSSASLEVAIGYGLQVLNRLNILGEELALLAQGAEHHFVGTQCGIMDQFIATLGRRDHALLIDCRDLSYRCVPLPTSIRIVVADSHIARTLASSAYNQRRAECERAVAMFRQRNPAITALRDVTPDWFAAHAALLPDVERARARHVISENDRAVRGAMALEVGDVAQFGQLMNQSHVSMRDDYQISTTEIDALVAAAQQAPGCLGSRLTGAGFGGCTVSLVEAAAVDAFCSTVAVRYHAATGRSVTWHVCQASDGVGPLIVDERPEQSL
jgi:galactokinase